MKPFNNIKYWFNRKTYQIKNLIRWFPLIWNQYPWDFYFITEMIRSQLLHMADYFDSDKAYSVNSSYNAKRMRLIAKLMDNVYNEKYLMEHQTEMEKLYGKSSIEFEDTGKTYYDDKTGKDVSYNIMVIKYERPYSKEELEKIEEHESELMKKGHIKHEKAHKLLWKLMEHHIRDFWD